MQALNEILPNELTSDELLLWEIERQVLLAEKSNQLAFHKLEECFRKGNALMTSVTGQ